MPKLDTNLPKYYKLGETATAFYDPGSRLNISNKVIGKLDVAPNKRIREAVKHGHIVEVDEEEYTKFLNGEAKGNKTLQETSKSADIGKLNSKQLVAYYKENYEPTEDDLKLFDKMTVPEKREFLTGDEEEEEEEEEED